jgi:hypothetical protein
LITLPVVRVPFPDRDNRTDRLIVPSSRQPARYEVDAPDVPVVREQMTHERGAASLPIASAPTALPLAAVPAPTPQPAPERSAASERQASVLRGSMLPAQNATVESTADRAAAKQPSEIDIDQIVDRVHRKFIRQLAVEGERRGLR